MSEALISLSKSLLRAGNLFVARKQFVPFGYDVYLDVNALSRRWDREVALVFDVGANVGQTTARMLKEFDRARIHAFEPAEQTFKQLLHSVAGNARVTPHNLALSDRAGEFDFFESGESKVGSLLADSPFNVRFERSTTRSRVICQTLDGFCGENGITSIDLLKLDTEGNDLSVLKGGERMLGEQRIRFVFVEYNFLVPDPASPAGSLSEIGAYLDRFGLKLVATYTEYVVPTSPFFSVSSALFALPPATPAEPVDEPTPMISPFSP